MSDLIRERLRSKQKPAPPLSLADYWTPNAGPQTQFVESDCREILYGGAAGGGKSAALTALPLKWAHLDGFNSLTLRRTFKQGKQLRKYSRQLYRRPFPGLNPIKSDGYQWTFPSGAEASYGHCQNTDDHLNYDGWEINLLCFDELTHFTKTQYDYICARVRSSDKKLPTLIRATTNPGGPGHDWVFGHWGAWLDPEFEAPGLEGRRDENGEKLPPAKPGEVIWIRTDDEGAEEYFRKKTPGAQSRTFIPAAIADNPHIDDEYRLELNKLDPVRRAQLKDGNWLVRHAAGLLFRREWVEFVDAIPDGARKIRCWDLAASEKKTADYTAGGIVAIHNGYVYIGDVIRRKSSPGSVEDLILSTAQKDGTTVPIGLPQDPGQAGVFQASSYVKLLAGFTLRIKTETGDKVTRFSPFSSQAEHRRVRLVRGPWNNEYLSELEAFPTKGVNDDQVDFTSGGYSRLTSSATSIAEVASAIKLRDGRIFR